MEKVYRVQDKDGRGPWKPGFSQRWIEDRPDHANLPPWYYEFGQPVLIPGEHNGSGCITVEQLRRWFTASEYKWLKGKGYQAVCIHVDRVIFKSDIQCLFGRRTSLKKGITIFELYND